MSNAVKARKMPEPRNGVDTPTLLTTINAVAEQPALAKFQFRAKNRWQLGTHSRTRLQSISGAGGEQMHEQEFVYDADHPAILAGRGQGATPVEFLLHGLLACLTAGIGNIAAARSVTPQSRLATRLSKRRRVCSRLWSRGVSAMVPNVSALCCCAGHWWRCPSSILTTSSCRTRSRSRCSGSGSRSV